MGKNIINCCRITSAMERKTMKCRRKRDRKVFDLPRKFTRKQCTRGVKGFTMRSSCSPYRGCKK